MITDDCDDNGANNVEDYDLFYDTTLIMMIHLATMFHDIINKKVHNRQVQIRGEKIKNNKIDKSLHFHYFLFIIREHPYIES